MTLDPDTQFVVFLEADHRLYFHGQCFDRAIAYKLFDKTFSEYIFELVDKLERYVEVIAMNGSFLLSQFVD